MERFTSVNGTRAGQLFHGACLLAVVWLYFAVPNRFELFNAELLAVYLIGAMALNLLTTTGLLSIGHSAIFMVSAYVVAILTVRHDWSYWPAAVVACLGCWGLGLVLGIPALRLRAFTLAMVTFGYAVVTSELATEWRSLTGGTAGMVGVRLPDGINDLSDYYWVAFAAVVVTYVICHNLLRSPFGRAGRALALQPVAAEAVGIDPFRSRLKAFGLSSVLAGVAGALYVPLLGFITPDALGVDISVLLLLMVFLGGNATLAGPVIGAVVLFRLPLEINDLTANPGEWSLLAYGVVLAVAVQFIPRGLVGGYFSLVSRLRRRRPGPGPVEARSRARAEVAQVLALGSPSPDEPVVEVRGARKNLGGVQALDGVDLRVEAGTVHALIGPNGSGKTTFLNALSGFIELDEGEEAAFGSPLRGVSASQRARRGIGRTFQTPLLFQDLSCVENLLVALDMDRRHSLLHYVLRLPGARRAERASYDRAVELLAAVGLADRAAAPAASLPPGEKRLLEIARVMALGPRAILMDEPAAGLTSGEIQELEEVIGALRAAGLGVVLVEHHAAMVMRVSDVVTVIDFGRVIACGTPDQVREDPAVVSAYLGSSLETIDAAVDAVEAAEGVRPS